MVKGILFNSIFLFPLDKMAKFQIETGEKNSILRNISTDIHPSELKNYRRLAEDMIKHIKNPDNGGVWLAAPQVGVNKRLIVVSLMKTYEDETFKTIALINPLITEHSEETCIDAEGCLSVPGETGDVTRWKWVKVSFLDIDGKKYTMKLTDLAARIVQHEIDHLDGILFTDKVENESLIKMM